MQPAHNNNFDFLRFFAATLVWFGHCYVIFGRSYEYGWCGGWGVGIFFAVSGYFITRSYAQHGRLLPYIKNRALRILPAMFVVILLSVFVLGPLVTTLSLSDYFADHHTWRYLRSLLIFPLQYELPGVFKNNPVDAVNGSLWTLQHEVRCYIGVALLGVLGILRPRIGLLVTAALWCTYLYGMFANMGMVPHIQLMNHWDWGKVELNTRLAILFSEGALLYVLREHIALKKEYFTLAVLLLIASVRMEGVISTILFMAALPYAVIYLGFLRLPLLAHFGRFGDFSYGMYLYAFPIQQLTMQLLKGRSDFFTMMIVSFCAVLLCAIASWHYVEKPALALKR